ncbi:peptidylprolyl isomerase FPR4 NDAI_0J02830 [Naumovozyma dairenensis CBS 421]|uniref:FK506-binding protein n=1 Tax=Naumovozyma dairenensis (strain ATCC 10597 / BCRC 20456 / CBS 421 / NBRC 0211 / NRRL Y-12639) TaxID=1071378 RepID=G0WH97_NAUDC|nr:hypothetical protein NDAI_0J02830 [Naumovozyma dairenensis CBS 421]CCD27175.1 hypothetical protein NDAI_0J02830 [Naumovozyma dairenensis CBS 421]
MSDMLPIAMYNLNVDPYDPTLAVNSETPVTIRITMASIDPTPIDDKKLPSTLRIIKKTPGFGDDGCCGHDHDHDHDHEHEHVDSEEEIEEKDLAKKVADELEEEEDQEFQECILLTLSPETQYQQRLDITIAPEEEVHFVVTGSYKMSLSGNYVKHPFDAPIDSEDEVEDEEDYELEGQSDSEEESDELVSTPEEDEEIYHDAEDRLNAEIEDDLEEEEDIDAKLEALENASDIDAHLEDLISKDEKNSKKRKQDKQAEQSQNKNKKAKKDKVEEPVSKKVKKVEFKKDLEEGPTKKKQEPKQKKQESKPKKEEPQPKKRTLQGGIIIEDRKVGEGSEARSGARVGMRYIGKLKNGKVFDKNTSGKPFTFKLGRGEVIRGWDIGVAGMAVGGERRITIPAQFAYGSQKLPGIPANSELTFDVKLVSMK